MLDTLLSGVRLCLRLFQENTYSRGDLLTASVSFPGQGSTNDAVLSLPLTSVFPAHQAQQRGNDEACRLDSLPESRRLLASPRGTADRNCQVGGSA
jgi:hypothetical protein